MKFLRKTIITSTALASLIAWEASAKTLTIGIDFSGSSPVGIEAFAHAAAKEVRKEILTLQPGDRVYVRTIGDRGLANLPLKEIRIDRRNRPNKVAEQVAGFIWNLPSHPPQAQGSTNLVDFFMHGRGFGCSEKSRIYLITDGIEHSEHISAKELLNGKPLPQPKPGLLTGCSVIFFGFGQNSSGKELPVKAVDNAEAAWTSFMKEAGASFEAIRKP